MMTDFLHIEVFILYRGNCMAFWLFLTMKINMCKLTVNFGVFFARIAAEFLRLTVIIEPLR